MRIPYSFITYEIIPSLNKIDKNVGEQGILEAIRNNMR